MRERAYELKITGLVELKDLCLASKLLHEAVTPRLYESVTLYVKRLSTARLRFLLGSISGDHLQHTKHLCIQDPFNKRPSARCFYYNHPDSMRWRK